MTRIVLWLKEPVLDEESNKKVIAYKIICLRGISTQLQLSLKKNKKAK